MRLLATSSLLLATPLLAQQFPEVEPNDTAAAAQVVALGSQINGSFSATDTTDWYTFTTTGGYHAIQIVGDSVVSAATNLDTVMDIFDASGTTLLAWCDDGGAIAIGGSPSYSYVSHSSFFGVIPAGTYTIRVKPFSAPTALVTYQFNLGQTASKPYTGVEVEPNGTLATAQLVGDGAQLDASLAAPVVVNSNAAAAATVVSTGAVASSTATVITTAAPQLAGAYNGLYFVRFTSGANAGQSRRISSNTATAITTESWGTSIPAAADTFEIITNAVTILSDTVASATTTVITSTAALTSGLFTTPSNTHAVRFLTGANAGLSRAITANTATTITTAAWAAAPALGDQYIVVSGGSINSIALANPVTANQFGMAPGTGSVFWVRCTSGINAGQSRRVQVNTANTILLASGFANATAPGDTFEVDQYDSDLYRVDVTAPKALAVFSVTDGTLPWVSGWSYEVLDAAGALVSSTTLGTNLADSGAFTNRVSSFRVFPTGTYYVRIFQRRSLPTTSAPVVLTGNYRFELKVRDMNTLGTVAETEPVGTQSNNTAASAQPINPGQVGVGNITNSAGADPSDLWGPLTIPAGAGLITLQVSAAATGTPLTDATLEIVQLLDPVLGTLSAPSQVLGGNTLEAGNLNPRGAFNFSLAGAQYFLRVLSPGAGAGQSGDYNLEISVTDSPTYLTGNYGTAATNATGCGSPGVPTIGRVGTTELPVVGQTFVQRVTNLNGLGNLGLLVMGLSGAQGPSGLPAGSPASVYSPTGIDLTLLGAPGCTLNIDPLVVNVLVGNAAGTVDYALAIPGNLALTGYTLFMQPCKWDFATPINALGIQPGNWSRVIVGSRSF